MATLWSQRKRSRALTRDISPNFTKALANYFGMGPTDVDASRAAHANYVAALRENGVEVEILPGLTDYPDCTFVEDAGVVIDDAVVIANDTDYGLAAYVSGQDKDMLTTIGRRLRAGQVHINYGSGGADAPFGGYKQSGNGREKAEWGLEEFLEVKAIMGA